MKIVKLRKISNNHYLLIDRDKVENGLYETKIISESQYNKALQNGISISEPIKEINKDRVLVYEDEVAEIKSVTKVVRHLLKEERKAKIRFMLEGDKEYGILTNEMYIDYAERVYEIVSHINNKNQSDRVNIQLDVSKYLKQPIELKDIFWWMTYSTLDITLKEHLGQNYDCKGLRVEEANEFKILSNLITKLTEPVINIDKLKNVRSSIPKSINIIYNDGNNCIMKCTKVDKGDYEEIISLSLLVIIRDKKIVYITTLGHDEHHTYENMQKTIGKTFVNSIISRLDYKDKVCRWSIAGLKIPECFQSSIKDNLRNTIYILGEQSIDGQTYAKDVVDLTSGELYEVKMSNFDVLSEVRKRSWEEWETSERREIDIRDYFDAGKKQLEYLNYQPQKVIKDYDEDGDAYIQSLGDYVYKTNIRANNCSTLIEKIFKLGVYKKTGYNRRSLNNRINRHRDGNLTKVKFIENLKLGTITEYIAEDGEEYFLEVEEGKRFYKSVVSIKRLVEALWIIGWTRANKPFKSDLGISNNRINIDKYVVIQTSFDKYYSRIGVNGYKILLAIDKMNGDSYILREYLDTEFNSIFRFKSLKDAVEVYSDAVCNNQNIDKDMLVSYENNIEVRSLIMGGLYSSYPYIGQNSELVSKLAKQSETLQIDDSDI